MLRVMKIAFPTRDNEYMVAHFGNMKRFLIIDVVDGNEVGRREQDMSGMPACGDPNASRPDYVVGVAKDFDVVIANGIGAPLVQKMQHAGVEVVLTSNLSISEALAAYLAGTLANEAELAHAPHH
jgi:predicted Fe-Mo cluster-binding NifX family protein